MCKAPAPRRLPDDAKATTTTERFRMSYTSRRSQRSRRLHGALTLLLVGVVATLASCDGRSDRDRAEKATAAARSDAAADQSRGALMKVGAPELARGAASAPAAAPEPQRLQAPAGSMQLPGSEALASPMLIRTGNASIQ